jgi:hypothetical protein
MPFGLRFGSSQKKVDASSVKVEIKGPDFHDAVELPVHGTVIDRDYPSKATNYRLDIRFHVDKSIVHIYLQHLGENDTLFLFGEPNNPPGMAPGVRFIGTISHGTKGHGGGGRDEDRDHCTITCEADGQTADCCIICTTGSNTAKICC